MEQNQNNQADDDDEDVDDASIVVAAAATAAEQREKRRISEEKKLGSSLVEGTHWSSTTGKRRCIENRSLPNTNATRGKNSS